MNDANRLTSDQATRLRADADALDARAAEIVAAAPGVGGFEERKLDARLMREADGMRRKARRWRDRAARADTCGVRISDHAVLRHIERVYGLDLTAVYAEILPAGTADVVARLGDGEYPVETAAGVHLVTVRERVVVTVTCLRSADGRPTN